MHFRYIFNSCFKRPYALRIEKPSLISLRLLIAICFLTNTAGCKKFVHVDTPPNNLSQQNVFSNDKAAISVLTGLFNPNISSDIAQYCGLLADEFVLSFNNSLLKGYYSNSLVSTDGSDGLPPSTGKETWEAGYRLIYHCNAAIDGLNMSTSLTPSIRDLLLGEAHFMRAWYYFYLTNLYGDVPLATGVKAEVNRQLLRTAKSSVYQFIIEDLLKAKELLSTSYLDGNLKPYDGDAERVRPTHWAATAMLARVYLYAGEFTKSESEASNVINHTEKFELLPYASVYLKNSREAIWQTQPLATGWNTTDGRIFHLGASPQGISRRKQVQLSSFLLNAFEPNDIRRLEWVDSIIVQSDTKYFPVKYKEAQENSAIIGPEVMTEYTMMLRLGEQYLIRAEARAREGDLASAVADLDVIRSRANLILFSDTNPGISQEDLINAILHERQIELFTEWGHRWFDLLRSGKADVVMATVTPLKGGTWETTDQLLPIPYTELQLNLNLTQNPGY
jgi:starch-binding outer membrane protein, SusD/RagB family